MKYAIRVEEILARTVIVEAEDLEDAIEKVEDAANHDEIFLDGILDFVERRIHASDVFMNGIVPEEADVRHYEHLNLRRNEVVEMIENGRPKFMSRDEMIAFIKSNPNVRITHSLFEEYEYIYSDADGMVWDENGNLFEDWGLLETQFSWNGIRSRDGKIWDDGWRIKQ